MIELPFVLDFVIAIAGALIGGALVLRFKLPAVVGYLAAGIMVGPYTPGPITDLGRVTILATFGVAFLMFALGTQFSLPQLNPYARIMALGAPLQIALTVGLAVLVAWLFKLSIVQGAVFGMIIASSSTVVLVKVLNDRREMDTLHGRLSLAFSLGQDILVVPLVVLLPFIGGRGEGISSSLARDMGEALAVIVGTYLVGIRLLPIVLDRVAELARELFLLSIVLIAVGVAVLMEMLGISFVLGAFLAGLMVANSRYSQQVLSDTIPLRDIFAPFFFVSVGMLLDIDFVMRNPLPVLISTLVVVVGKGIIVGIVSLLFRYPMRSSLLTALSLAQIGEFSFVLSQIALSGRIIGEDVYSLVIAGALISIILNPIIMGLGSPVVRFLTRERARVTSGAT